MKIIKKILIMVIVGLFFGASILPTILGNDIYDNDYIIKDTTENKYENIGIDEWAIIEVVGYWNFDDDLGNNAYDSSVYENHGSCIKTRRTDGVNGNALLFSGRRNSAVMVEDDPSLDFDDLGENEGFMIDFWMKNRWTIFEQSYVGLISKQYQGGYMVGFGEDKKVGFSIKSYDGENVESISVISNTEIHDRNWHHIVAIWSGDTLFIYLDNMETPDNIKYVGDFKIADTYKWLDFGNDWPTDDLNPFDGRLDEIQISIIKPIGENTLPKADFKWAPYKSKINEEVTFNASNSVDSDGWIELYEWDWNDDGFFDNSYNESIAYHSWSSSDEHMVTLKVTDNDGGSSIKKGKIHVDRNIKPTVEIITPSFGNGLNNVVTIEGIADDYDGIIEGVEIQISKNQDPLIGEWEQAQGVNNWSFRFDVEQYDKGTWIIFSRSIDNNGENSDIDYIAVGMSTVGLNDPPYTPDPPSGKNMLSVGKTYFFSGIIKDPNGDMVVCEFNWGDGTSYTSKIQKPTGSKFFGINSWTNVGLFEIKIRGKDSSGLVGDYSLSFNVTVGSGNYYNFNQNIWLHKMNNRFFDMIFNRINVVLV